MHLATRQITLRAAQQSDIPALVGLLRRSWLVTWAPELPFDAVQLFAREDPAAAYGMTMWNHFQVAAENDRLLGMIHVDGDRVAAIHVDPAAKGEGIGTRLMAWAEQRIGGAHAIARLEVRAFNVAAQGFYHHRGWEEARRYLDTECGAPVETLELHKHLQLHPPSPR